MYQMGKYEKMANEMFKDLTNRMAQNRMSEDLWNKKLKMDARKRMSENPKKISENLPTQKTEIKHEIECQIKNHVECQKICQINFRSCCRWHQGQICQTNFKWKVGNHSKKQFFIFMFFLLISACFSGPAWITAFWGHSCSICCQEQNKTIRNLHAKRHKIFWKNPSFFMHIFLNCMFIWIYK